MNEGRIKWFFVLVSVSIFSFCLGWWLHTSQALCTTDCIFQSNYEHQSYHPNIIPYRNNLDTSNNNNNNNSSGKQSVVWWVYYQGCGLVGLIWYLFWLRIIFSVIFVALLFKKSLTQYWFKTIPVLYKIMYQQALCNVSLITDNDRNQTLPTIFMITPTYARHTQKADLTRLCQTLMHVKNLHWLVVEDSDSKTPLVTRFLDRCRVKSSQLNRKTSLKLQPSKVSHKGHKNRGAEQRNIALDWLSEHYHPGEVTGVVYFGDDDNTYDIQLFEEMRYTKKVSIWPVGLAGGLKAEGPICKNGRVTSWHAGWSPNRKFPVDMAAFAVNLDIILTNNKARLNPFGPGGHLEPEFLSTITTVPELEAKADNCTKVYVWHTQTSRPSIRYEDKVPTLIETKK